MKKKVSRQRRWQLKQKRLKRCIICGKPSVVALHCQYHREKNNASQRLTMRKARHPYRCSRCLQTGHNIRTCRKVFRFWSPHTKEHEHAKKKVIYRIKVDKEN